MRRRSTFQNHRPFAWLWASMLSTCAFLSGCQLPGSHAKQEVASLSPSEQPKYGHPVATTESPAVSQAGGSGAAFPPTVRISGVRPGGGPVRVAVFGEGGEFPNHENAVMTLDLPSSDNTTQGQLGRLPPSRFAVAVYQDLNNDGRLNKSSFGLPAEPYGFSNSARGQFGPPAFQDAMLELGQTAAIEVALQ